METNVALQDVIWRDPERMSGVPCFYGTRVPVQTLIDYLDAGYPIDEFLRLFPTVEKHQAHAYLWAAHRAILKSTS